MIIKNKRVRRISALLLACALLGGCSRKKELPKAEEDRVRLTALQYELENQAVDFDGLWFYRQLEEKTGVHVDFEAVRDAEWENRERLMFASGTYTDMVLRGSLDTEEYGVTQGKLIALDAYLDEYMPIYSARLKESGLQGTALASDEHTYYVGFMLSQDVNTNGHYFINRNWLDRLGLSMPRTVEELTEVLRAFRDGDPNGNGLKDEVPYEATLDDCNTGLYNAFSSFGIPMNEEFVFADGEGKVHFAPYTNGFRETLDWLHMLVEEKLMDPESLTQGSTLWSAKVNKDTAGFFSYWRLSNTALHREIADQFELMLPVSASGYEVSLSRLKDVIEFGASLTIQNQNIPASLKWLDAQMETETMLVSQNGPVGEMLSLREDGRYEVVHVPDQNELYSIVPVIVGQFFAPEEYYSQVYVPAPHRLEKSGYCSLYEEAGVLEEVSFKTVTTEAPRTSRESARIMELHKRLKTIVDSFIVDTVVNGGTDQKYSAFLRSLKEAGAEEYTELYQQVYTRYTDRSREMEP